MKKCFFIGHRYVSKEIEQLLLNVIEKHIIEYGVTEFYVGHYSGFSHMAVEALCKMKEKYPYIKNYLLLAYHSSIKHVEKPEGFECTIFMDSQDSVPPKFAISRLNQTMIRKVDYLICYVEHVTDGSYKALETATKRVKKGKIVITNLGEL